MATQLYADEEHQPSLLFLIVDAIAFWVRSPLAFWIVTLPIAGLAAAVTYVLDVNQSLVEFRNHWGWNFLFALIYAMFLDRWIKASLLEDASPCDEVDNLRRSIISPRFLAYATFLFLLAMAMAPSRYVEVNIVLWSASACMFALLLPSLSAAEPLTLREAFALGRPLQIHLFLLIGGAIAVSLLAGVGFERAALYLPNKPWNGAAVAAVHRIVDCLLLAIIANVLAETFREMTDWRQPEPDDHPYRNMGLGRRKLADR